MKVPNTGAAVTVAAAQSSKQGSSALPPGFKSKPDRVEVIISDPTKKPSKKQPNGMTYFCGNVCTINPDSEKSEKAVGLLALGVASVAVTAVPSFIYCLAEKNDCKDNNEFLVWGAMTAGLYSLLWCCLCLVNGSISRINNI